MGPAPGPVQPLRTGQRLSAEPIDACEAICIPAELRTGTASKHTCRVQVLMATHLKRTESVVQPALFRFDEHFELQDLIGASRNSEVRLFSGRPTEMSGPHIQCLPAVVPTHVARTSASLRITSKGCPVGHKTCRCRAHHCS